MRVDFRENQKGKESGRLPDRPARTQQGRGYLNPVIDSTNRTRSACREMACFW